MEFEWDEAKNRQNIAKHGVSFKDAIKIFEGFTFDAHDGRFDYGEERTISIGMAGNVAVLVVVHTDRHLPHHLSPPGHKERTKTI